MRITKRIRMSGMVAAAMVTALILVQKPMAGESSKEADGARFLQGAIDLHWHIDTPGEKGDISIAKVARARGMRALVLKSHWEPTGSMAYFFSREVPNINLFGGIVLNRTNGGINPAAVEYMAAKVKGAPGKIVWMPAGESEIESRTSKQPNKPFVAVSRNGELLPEVKAVIALIVKYNLTLASGHISPEEALMVFREARQGVQHMIATHPMDFAGKMNMDQMLEAAKLGAILEFDFRNILDEGGRADAIRKIGPEHCFISEFWTKNSLPREYAGLDGVGTFVQAMRARGFTDHEMDLMVKENPARLLGLSPEPVTAKSSR